MNLKEPDTFGARAAAAALIKEYGIRDPSGIRVEDIAYDRGVGIWEMPLSGLEGWLFRDGRRGRIGVRKDIPELGRRRFTIAHELGHWERHMRESQAWLCTSGDIHTYRGSRAEIEANAFAAELLMPTPLFRPYANRGVTMAMVCDLADKFQTTLTATAVRLVEEAAEDCYVVFSRKGCIRWWKRNPDKASQWISAGRAIHPESLAWACEASPRHSTGMATVPTEAWFPEAVDAGEIQVYEESVLLGEYDTVLTLLCVV